MTSSLAKVNKLSSTHFRALFLKFPNFSMFLNIQKDLLILKTYDGQFTLTTKKSLHFIFKAQDKVTHYWLSGHLHHKESLPAKNWLNQAHM